MTTICHPTTAWANPDVTIPDDGLSPEGLALFEQQVANAEALAWTVYRRLTGDTVSICATTVRPVAPKHGVPTWLSAPVDSFIGGGAPFAPTIVAGEWLNVWCGFGDDLDECGCGQRFALELPGGIAKVESISIDGVELPASAYYVLDSTTLVRKDGEPWPMRQDWQATAGEGVFQISYWQGSVPDALDYMAVGILANEFLKAIRNEKGCRLPSGVRSISRQGVSFDVEVDIFERGLTGIREVDMVTARRNPNRLRTPPRVLAPKSRKARMVTGGA